MTVVSFAAVEAAFRERLDLRHEPDLIPVTLAPVIAIQVPGDPLWIMLVGPSSSGKSECVQALGEVPRVEAVSTLTPNALLSGYRDPGAAGDPSLLLRLDGRCLAVKDLTAIFGQRREHVAETFGLLRDAYDSEAVRWTGKGRITARARFTCLMACTEAIEDHRTRIQPLGERFLYFRIGRVGKVADKLRSGRADKAASQQLRKLVADFVAGVTVPSPPPPLPGSFVDELISHAESLALARCHVSRDSYTREIDARPSPEEPHRVFAELRAAAWTLAAMGLDAERARRICARLAYDSIPTLRRLTIAALLRWPLSPGDEPSPRRSMIARRIRISRTTLDRAIEDLEVLGLVRGDTVFREELAALRQVARPAVGSAAAAAASSQSATPAEPQCAPSRGPGAPSDAKAASVATDTAEPAAQVTATPSSQDGGAYHLPFDPLTVPPDPRCSRTCGAASGMFASEQDGPLKTGREAH